MDGNVVAVIALLVVNTGGIAYGYGKLTQKVSDVCRRLDRIEKLANNRKVER